MTLIEIVDCGTKVVYRLDVNRLTMVETGGCEDVLNRDDVRVDESMTARDIADRVHDAWVDGGYDGDPVENDLQVIVEVAS